MLYLSFVLLTAGSALGALLAALVMRPNGKRPSWLVGAAHGSVGAIGLAVLILSLLRSEPRGVAQGVSMFGWDAVVLLGAALLAGLIVLLRRGKSGLVLALHAVLAMFGDVILLAYVSI